MPIRTVAAAFIALLLAACNPMAQLDGAEQEIAQFHETYNAGDSRRLYGQTAEEFREVTTPEQMDELITLVTEKMGAVQSTERSGFNVNAGTDETTTTVTMSTTFAKGEGTETFTFYGSGDEMRIVGWNVDSPNFAETEPVEEDEGEGSEVAE